MSYLDFKDTITKARAHSLAAAEAGYRQVHVTIQFYMVGAKVYSFESCIGHCPKCDRIWIDLRRFLPSLEVVQVRPFEAAAPDEPEVLPD